MAEPRSGTYIWITWLSKVMAGEQSCEWASWFKAHHTYTKLPSDFDVAAWSVDHTRKLRELHVERRKMSEVVGLEGENSLKFTTATGIVLAGKPDLIATAGDDVTVYDVKTGQQRKSDSIQVMLYMYLVPQSLSQYKGSMPSGCVVYNDSRVRIPATAVDDRFVDNFNYFLEIVGGSEPPLKVPSPMECRFCDIPKSECVERQNPDSGRNR